MLLAKFVSGGRSEAAFTELVLWYGGLIYSSALRRTEDRDLAEEVTQNVFAVIARKAASLRDHPSLTAWIFQTTKLEAAKIMRTERRRHRKHAAFALEMSSSPAASDSSENDAWREAIPILDESLDRLPEGDRELVLQRFYEKRKYREIAAQVGKSEAACKMQLKRALAKLSRFLALRGVTLSAGAIASGLGVELARAAPAVVSIVPKALATSSSLTSTALTINTIQTMSQIKTITLAVVVVLAVASVPLVWQESRASSLRRDLEDTRKRRETIVALSTGDSVNQDATLDGVSRAVEDLLASAERPIDADEIIESLSEVLMDQDFLGMMRLMFPVARLSADEYRELMADLEAYEGNSQIKQMALQMIGSMAPPEDAQKSLERMLDLGMDAGVYANLLGQWAATDSEAAYAWYEEKLSAGELTGKGVHRTPDRILLSAVLGGMVEDDPERAIRIFSGIEDRETRTQVMWRFGSSMGRVIKNTGDDAAFRSFLDVISAIDAREHSRSRRNMVSAALRIVVEKGDFDAGLAFANRYLNTSTDRSEAVLDMLVFQGSTPIEDRAEWLLDNMSPGEAPQAMRRLIDRASRDNPHDLSGWLNSQPAGPIRDHGFTQLAQSQAGQGSHEQAYGHAQMVEDGTLRADAIDRVARSWMKSDPESARRGLPEDLVSKYSDN